MINDICDAYTYIEFGKSFNKYKKMRVNSLGYESNALEVIQEDWEHICKQYKTLSEFMSDSAIKQTHKAIMNLY